MVDVLGELILVASAIVVFFYFDNDDFEEEFFEIQFIVKDDLGNAILVLPPVKVCVENVAPIVLSIEVNSVKVIVGKSIYFLFMVIVDDGNMLVDEEVQKVKVDLSACGGLVEVMLLEMVFSLGIFKGEI